MSHALINSLGCDDENFRRGIFEPESSQNLKLHSFYPDESFTEREISFRGNLIAVLNSYIPMSLNYQFGGLFYLGFKRFGVRAIEPSFIARQEIFPLWGGNKINVDYEEFYLTWNPDNQVLNIVNASWDFALDKDISTPIILFMGKDVAIHDVPKFSEENFRMGFKGTEPAAFGIADITIEHGLEIKEVAVVVTASNFANALNIKIRQTSFNSLHNIIEFDENPASFPFTKTYVLPNKGCALTRIQVAGGGGAPSGNISVVAHMRPLI